MSDNRHFFREGSVDIRIWNDKIKTLDVEIILLHDTNDYTIYCLRGRAIGCRFRIIDAISTPHLPFHVASNVISAPTIGGFHSIIFDVQNFH